MNTDVHLTETLTALSTKLRELYLAARAAYRATRHARALELNEDLHREACAEGNVLGRILGRRFAGLCHYRLNNLDESERALREALKLAEEAGDVAQQLLITNHLASTVRRRGLLDEAFDLLTSALSRPSMTGCVHPYARLIGNLGALYDELGQRAHADDCYARFEVLAELHGNPHWIANARSLAARAAELRKDLEAAESKYREERELAQKNHDTLRQIASTIHAAKIAARKGDADGAETLLLEALDNSRHCDYEKRRIDALEAYADFLFHYRSDLPRANYYLALAEKQAASEPEKLANIAHRRALVCKEAGLRGESLHYLMKSLQARAAIYEPLKHPRVREMAKERLKELRELTDELVAEALQIDRSGTEREDIKELIVRVSGQEVWAQYEKQLNTHQGPPIWSWRAGAKDNAGKIWLRRITQPVFEEFLPETRQALIRAGVSYGSAIDDLTRSAQLLALAIEHELKARVFLPAESHLHIPRSSNSKGRSKTHQHFAGKGRWTLGAMLESLQEVVDNTSARPGDALVRFRGLLANMTPQVKRVAGLNGEISPLKGQPQRLLDIRNESVHDLSVNLDRLQVDAITRIIALEISGRDEPTVMTALSKLRIP